MYKSTHPANYLFVSLRWMVALFLLALASSVRVEAQWTPNGNNINNTNSGNVGVGTTSPAQKLDVAGAIATSGTTVIDGSRNITNAGTGTFSGTRAEIIGYVLLPAHF